MTLTSGIFNSVNGDRKYNAQWFASYFASFIGNGVFPNPSTGLQVIGNTNMTTIVRPGQGWINGYYLINDANHILTHDVADGVLKRIDRVVMRLNHLTRQIEVVIKKGAYASTPVAPVLQRNVDAYELALADVLINNGATVITQASITDQRLNSALCGIVHGVVDQVDTTTIFNQYQSWFGEFTVDKQADFEEWMETLKDILDGDVAANLASRITSLEGTVATHLADLTYQIATGTATALIVPMATLVNGYSKTFIASVTSTSTAKTINGKPFYKPSTTVSPSLVAGKAYTVWYNATSDCFFIKASAEGTATTAQVLAGVPFSNETDTGLIGAMPNRGSVGTQNLTFQNAQYIIPAGYHNGAGKVVATYAAGRPMQVGTFVGGGAIAITGLPFTPTTVMCFNTNGYNWFGVADKTAVPPDKWSMGYYNVLNSTMTLNMNLGVSWTSNGFTLPNVYVPNVVGTWIAFG